MVKRNKSKTLEELFGEKEQEGHVQLMKNMIRNTGCKN